MAICGYVVIPAEGAATALTERLSALPGCQVARATNPDVLLLVTDTPESNDHLALRNMVERMDGVRALMLTFAEVDPPPRACAP